MKLASALAIAVAMTATTTGPAAAQDAAAATSTTAAKATPAGIPTAADDPFIWLEEARSEPALAWVRAENERSLQTLGQDPRFATLQAEALSILDAKDRIPGVGFTPYGLVNFWQDPANPRGLLRVTTLDSYRTDNPVWETILDVDAIAKAEGREWVYKGMTCLPPAGTRCMVALSDGGKDATELREFDIATRSFVKDGFFLPESQGGVQWLDQDTLLVSRSFGDDTITESKYPFTTREWKRGTRIEDAPEIFRGQPSDVSSQAFLLRDNEGTVHARAARRGTSFFESDNFVWSGGEWLKLDMPKKSGFGGIIDGQLLFSISEPWTIGGTTYPTDSILSADLAAFKADPNGAPKTLVWKPAERQTAQGISTTKDSLYVSLLDNVRGKVLKFDHDASGWRSVPVDLPANATLGVAAASDETGEVMFASTDFLTPSQVWYTDGTGKPALLKTSPARFDPKGLEISQHEATSRDGTKIPYFVVSKKGVKMDGSTPTLLYGYGGFQNAMLPSYSGTMGKMWLERGGAYVLGNMRGGGEFGPDWHQTAMRENKQRTWDDFIAIAEDVQKRGLTSPRRLGVMGGSQGGLLVGTAITQRPELFNAAIVQVPLFDMLRLTEIGRGASWVGEYGDPRIPEQRKWIEAYSPYQKLTESVTYPDPFFWASTADDRTHPSHARKAAAKMSAMGKPYYYFEDMTGGHSGGVDNAQRAKIQALQYVYLMQRLMD
ncbi:prolyl oligopeptidase family serine peptidase [Tsuneonella amylolytica]|uniref:prolyl oligopeptidase family serine peptidase n=1 Tax=Tsuneonella amylolytica TaxID=2338327 RepID=UPI001F27D47B|nr:prolyl oligopeptidase family serine peptidase [Tsuneonella amylolytica]